MFDGKDTANGVPLTALEGRELVAAGTEGVPDTTFDGRDFVEGVGTDGVPDTTFDGKDVAEDVPLAVLDGKDVGIVGISA